MDEWEGEDWEDWAGSSATAKLARANELLNSIDAEIRDFFEVDPYVVASEANAETGERLMRVVAIDTPPIRLSITGFPLLVKAPRGKFADFPNVRGLSVSDRAIVERLQPYQARDPDEVFEQPLRVVHDLNVADKHKFLHLTGLSMESSTLQPSAPGARIRHSETFPGTFEDGAVLARVVVAPPEAEVDMNFDPTFDIAFEPGTTPWRDMPVVSTLTILAGAVEDALRSFPWAF